MKMYSFSKVSEKILKILDFTLEVLEYLYFIENIDQVPYPVKNIHGERKIEFMGYTLVIYRYVPYPSLDEAGKLSKTIMWNLGVLLGTIHKKNVVIDNANKQEFDIAFRSSLIEGLETLHNPKTQLNLYQIKLRDLILPLEESIQQILNQLEDLIEKNRSIDRVSVLCHSDPIAHNMLVDEQENVFLITGIGHRSDIQNRICGSISIQNTKMLFLGVITQ